MDWLGGMGAQSSSKIPLPPLPTILLPTSSFQDVNAIFDALDDYLAYRTYFSGPSFGFGDCTLWGTIRSEPPAPLEG